MYTVRMFEDGMGLSLEGLLDRFQARNEDLAMGDALVFAIDQLQLCEYIEDWQATLRDEQRRARGDGQKAYRKALSRLHRLPEDETMQAAIIDMI